MKAFSLPGRAVLEMTGADVRAVLQGIVTNDVDAVTPDNAVYAALLTPQGKYLFDFFLLDGGPETILVDVAADRATALAQRIGMYCLRRDARVTGARTAPVVQVWRGAPEDDGAATDPPPAAPASCGAQMVVPDPRSSALGWRCYVADPGDFIAETGAHPVGQAEFDALRVDLMIPETGVELLSDETYILEARFEALHGVDFRKGCYVGQEVTARMKHKAELRKGMVQVDVEGAAAPGTGITIGGKPAGTIYTVADGRGLAHLRLDRAGLDMEAGDARVSYRG